MEADKSTGVAAIGSRNKVAALLRAEDVTRPKSGLDLPPDARRKMTHEEARAATIAVTRIIRRLDVGAREVCLAAKVASEAQNFYPFHLTKAEMDDEGNLIGELNPSRRYSRSLFHSAAMVREAAKIRQGSGDRIDVDELLEELAEAIPDYLAPFAAALHDPIEELAENLALLGHWFSRPRRDEVSRTDVDVREIVEFAVREGLEFDAEEGVFRAEATEPLYGSFGTFPSVPLFVRHVGAATMRVTKPVEDPYYSQNPFDLGPRETIGRASATVVELVSLAIILEPKGTRAVFLLTPWTIVTDAIDDDDYVLMENTIVRGTCFRLYPADDQECHLEDVSIEDVTFECPIWERYVRREFGKDDRLEHADWQDRLYAHHLLPIEPVILKTWMEGDDHSVRLTMTLDEVVPPWIGMLGLPRGATLEGGVTSYTLFDRMEEALYGPNFMLHELLLRQAAIRARARGAFEISRLQGRRKRRAEFLRIMKS